MAKPIGVVGCVTATTNPVINPMHNSMCALKCGNAVIISPHPRAKRVGARTVEVMNEALDRLGTPKNLIQIIAEPTMELSAGLMKSADLCICTGGPRAGEDGLLLRQARLWRRPGQCPGAGGPGCGL